MLIYILRHGQTEFNRLGIVQGSGVDSDLNDTGQQQAQAFYTTHCDKNFQLIVTSLLKRTHQTVAPFIESGIPWQQMADINEICWGDHEGQSATPVLMEAYERVIESWKNDELDVALPNGETARSLRDRLERFIEWLHTRPTERLLVCTHGRTMRALITMLKGKPISSMEETEHSNTGCYVLRLENGLFHQRLHH
jgi:probable phosphoglycerate mutase